LCGFLLEFLVWVRSAYASNSLFFKSDFTLLSIRPFNDKFKLLRNASTDKDIVLAHNFRGVKNCLKL
jgi:hypothetical protein